MEINKKSGISLLVLVITILVIIILSCTVILTLTNNNPMYQAKKTAFLSDLKNFETQLEDYKSDQFSNKFGRFNSKLLHANDLCVTYNNVVDNSMTILDLIPALSENLDYKEKIEVVNGQLVFVGTDEDEIDWSGEIGINAYVDEPKITFIHPLQTYVVSGTDIVYTIRFTSNLPLTTISLTGKLEVLDSFGVKLPIQPGISIGTVSGSSADITRDVVVTITTDALDVGSYKLKVIEGSATNSGNITISKDSISPIGFNINDGVQDTIPPENPIITASTTEWTKENVIVTITYTEDSTIKEFSLDGTTWSLYTTPISVSTNGTTIYAIATDDSENTSGASTLTINNIDKIPPTVTYGTNGAIDVETFSTTVTVNDIGGSEINASSLKYKWDTQNTTAPASGWTSFINGATISNGSVIGTYYLWITGIDNAENFVISKTNAFVTDNTAPIPPTLVANPTVWTNGDVTVTITYPADAATKERSLNGTTWSAYTAPITVSTNGTTVYARAKDSLGNTSSTATLTINNIDKVLPTVEFSPNGSGILKTVSTKVTLSDARGINANTLQCVWSTQSASAPASGWETFINEDTKTKGSVTGTYYLWVKGSDNTGNSITTRSNAFLIDNTAPVPPTFVINPTGWTNSDVQVTITYPADATTKEYSFDTTTWSSYTSVIPISLNGTVLYARAKDSLGNTSSTASVTISNIDKVAPTVAFSPNGGSGQSANPTVTLSDTRGINGSTLLCVWSTQSASAPASGWTSFANGDPIPKSGVTGTYYLWIKGSDNTGNEVITKSNAFTLTAPEPVINVYGLYYTNILSPSYGILYVGENGYGTVYFYVSYSGATQQLTLSKIKAQYPGMASIVSYTENPDSDITSGTGWIKVSHVPGACLVNPTGYAPIYTPQDLIFEAGWGGSNTVRFTRTYYVYY